MASVRTQLETAISAAVAALPDVRRVYDDPKEMLKELGTAQGEGKHLAIIAYDQDEANTGAVGMDAFRFGVFVLFVLHVPDDQHPRDVADALVSALYQVYATDGSWGGLARDTRVASFSSGVFLDDNLTGSVCVVHEFRVDYAFTEGHPEVVR